MKLIHHRHDPRTYARSSLALAVCMVMASAAFAQTAGHITVPPTAASFVVIVHPANPVSRLGSSFLAAAFLKKITRWDNGNVIHPVYLAVSSPARQRFDRDVLRRSTQGVRNYWQQLIFSGHGIPPLQFKTDQEVVHYVAVTPDSIGYVDGATDTRSVKVISVTRDR